MLKYEIYRIEEDQAVLESVRELKPTDYEQLKEIQKLDKKPDSEIFVGAIGSESVWALKKPKRPGLAKLTDELVLKCFKLRANERLSSFKIARQIGIEDGVPVSQESIDKVLKRVTYADVIIPQELLDQIENQKIVRKKRTSIREEDKPKIIELHDRGHGLSGRQISQMDEFNYSDVTINRFLQRELGFMVNGVRESGQK